MKVSELMTTNVARVRSDESLGTAAGVMWECDCGVVPVVDGSGERLIGILTDRDICMAVWSKDRAPSTITVSEAMAREVFCCSPNDSIGYAENLMRAKQIRRLPVKGEDGRLLGILSLADIARNGKPGVSELTPGDITTTLASIVQPRGNGAVAAGE
ncbi:MAG TPA: CBS domain-containing protein [Polyangiaceae bacterium]